MFGTGDEIRTHRKLIRGILNPLRTANTATPALLLLLVIPQGYDPCPNPYEGFALTSELWNQCAYLNIDRHLLSIPFMQILAFRLVRVFPAGQ